MVQGYIFIYSFIDRNISKNNYNLRNSQTDLSLPKPNRNFLKEALNIAVLTFGITFRWKLSKLIQSPFFEDILNKIFDNLSLDFIAYLYIFIGVTSP